MDDMHDLKMSTYDKGNHHGGGNRDNEGSSKKEEITMTKVKKHFDKSKLKC